MRRCSEISTDRLGQLAENLADLNAVDEELTGLRNDDLARLEA